MTASGRSSRRSASKASPLRYLLPAVALVVLGIVLFPSAGRDDSYITYWASASLAKFGQILNYNGERIEQSSSLLQILLLAAMSKGVSIPLHTLAPIVSILCGAATVLLTQQMAMRSLPQRFRSAGWLTATTASLVYWSFSGLESSLAAMLTVMLVILYDRWLYQPGRAPWLITVAAVTVAFLLVRPEAMFVAAAALAVAFVVDRIGPQTGQPVAEGPRRFLVLGGVVATSALVIIGFRLAYFGDLFPQPVAAKSHGLGMETVRRGVTYFINEALNWYTAPAWIAAALGGIVAIRPWARDVNASIDRLAAVFAAVLTAFVVASGGDWMEAGRFLVPAAPLVAVLAVSGLARVLPSRAASLAIAVLVIVQIAGTCVVAVERSYGMPIWMAASAERRALFPNLAFFDYANRLRDRDAPVAERVEAIVGDRWRATGRPVTLFTGQAGFIAYRLALTQYGHFRLIDRYGLVSRELTGCAMSDAVPRNAQGLRLSFVRFFNEEAGWSQCPGYVKPDVIVDIAHQNPAALRTIREHGYDLVFEQDQSEVEGSKLVPGAIVYRDSFIAVRRDAR